MLAPCAQTLDDPPVHVELCCDHKRVDNGVALVTACCLVNREALRDCPVESLPLPLWLIKQPFTAGPQSLARWCRMSRANGAAGIGQQAVIGALPDCLLPNAHCLI